MIRHMRHGSPPRLMALQSILRPNRREHLPPPSAGNRMKGLGPGGSVLGGRAVIAAEVEEIVDPVMGGEEALGLARRLEPLHLPFSPSRRLMGVFGPVVEAFMPPVLDRGHDLTLGGAVAGQLVRDHDT